MRVKFAGYVCDVVFDSYSNNKNTAISLLDALSGEPVIMASVNLTKLPPNQVAIKNYSEGEGIEAALIEAGIIGNEPILMIPSGFVNIPVYEILKRN